MINELVVDACEIMQIAMPVDVRRPTNQPIGNEVRQFHEQPNTARQSDLGISLGQLVSTLRGFWPNTSAGFLTMTAMGRFLPVVTTWLRALPISNRHPV